MKAVEPIIAVDLFSPLHTELLALLKSLSDADWNKPTAARAWRVKDIAAHLLDGNIRRLSFQRDHTPLPQPPFQIENYETLVDFLNQLNAEWVKAAQRISPKLLVEFLNITGAQVAQLFITLDPFAPAMFAVAWAGQEKSPNWFDIAREYTEQWHHQQQIREAIGAPGLVSRKWLNPVLDTFLRGLPHAYRASESCDGTKIKFIVTGEAGGEWTLLRENQKWELYTGNAPDAACQVRLHQDTAWRLMTNGLSAADVWDRVEITGERKLGMPILKMRAVMV